MRLRHATPQEIRYACLNFHYAKAIPACKWSYSVFNDSGGWCGVIVYSSGASPQIGKPYGLFQGEVLELVRVALNGKQKATSEAVSASLRMVRKDAKKVRMIVSYADTEQGHLGTIYQATNWKYVGVSKGHAYYVVNGKRLHSKTVTAKGWRQSEKWLRQNVDSSAKVVRGGDKYKYLFFFDKRLQKRISDMFLPYPKRANK